MGDQDESALRGARDEEADAPDPYEGDADDHAVEADDADDADDEADDADDEADDADDEANDADDEADEYEDDDDLDELDLERAEDAPAATACTRCRSVIDGEYYEGDGMLLCPACVKTLRYGEPGDSGIRRAGRAAGLGAAAAVVSALLWWGIREATGYEIGLIAIGVGLLVGFAVRAGARQQGGGFYQAMAVALTYLAIVSTYIPELMRELDTVPSEGTVYADGTPLSAEDLEYQASPLRVPIVFVLACVFSLAVPFLGGFENLIGIAIIGFALWEAWRVNRAPVKRIVGPFRIAERL